MEERPSWISVKGLSPVRTRVFVIVQCTISWIRRGDKWVTPATEMTGFVRPVKGICTHGPLGVYMGIRACPHRNHRAEILPTKQMR